MTPMFEKFITAKCILFHILLRFNCRQHTVYTQVFPYEYILKLSADWQGLNLCIIRMILDFVSTFSTTLKKSDFNNSCLWFEGFHEPRSRCQPNPCFKGVACMETFDFPGYSCGPCPEGMTGNGTHCKDIDEVGEGI